jgi:tungstate transport system permease protein
VGFILTSLAEAAGLIFRGDHELYSALRITLQVSLASTAIAALIGLPAAFLLARFDFRAKRALLLLLRTALAFPTVAVALLVYAFITRHGPLGSFGLLFTPTAIILGQIVLIVPLITALAHAALYEKLRDVYEEALLLGAHPLAAAWKTLLESRLAVLTALATGFGRVMSEVGISLILGGNIRGLTRTITTAITLETNRGDFALAFALGIVLLLLVLLINAGVQVAEARRGSA